MFGEVWGSNFDLKDENESPHYFHFVVLLLLAFLDKHGLHDCSTEAP